MNRVIENFKYKENPTVLIIEEQTDIARSVAGELQLLQANVLPLQNNSFAAMDLIRHEKVDLILMDLMLGGMDGIALLREIRALQLSEPPIIILVTPMDSEMIINEAARLGAAYVFLRPIKPKILAERSLEVYRDAFEASVFLSGQRYNVKDVRMAIVRALKEIGLPSHLLGYQFLISGLFFVVQQNGFRRDVTTRLYPYIAEQHQSTPQKVERSMRHAIEATWSRGDLGNLHRIFGNTVQRSSGRPTNSEFLARMTDYVLMNLCI